MENEDPDYDFSTEERDEKWILLIEEWRESGQSIAEWVRERGEITYGQFMKARKRLFPEEIRKSEFMETETTWSTLTMEIPSSTLDVFVNDCRIVVSTGFDQELLREVVEVLKHAD
jgi:hypothetical protein